MHVGALFCLIVAKLFMLKVCIQSVHHGGIKFAMASLKFCCTKTRLEICCTRIYNAYVIVVCFFRFVDFNFALTIYIEVEDFS